MGDYRSPISQTRNFFRRCRGEHCSPFYFFTKTLDIKSALGIIMQIEKILLNIS